MRKNSLLAAMACAILLVGCGRKTPQAPVIAYIDGALIPGAAERVGMVRELLAPGAALDIEDAAFVLQQRFKGERVDEPLEAVFFGRLTLAPGAADALKARLKPMPRPPYAAPEPSPAWWPAQEEFDAMEFFEAKGIFEYPSGFAAFDRAGGVAVMSAKP